MSTWSHWSRPRSWIPHRRRPQPGRAHRHRQRSWPVSLPRTFVSLTQPLPTFLFPTGENLPNKETPQRLGPWKDLGREDLGTETGRSCDTETPSPRSENPHNEESQVEKFGDFP